jgi:hypothetical protein
VVSALVSALTFGLIEYPFLKLRARLLENRRQPVMPVPKDSGSATAIPAAA